MTYCDLFVSWTRPAEPILFVSTSSINLIADLYQLGLVYSADVCVKLVLFHLLRPTYL